MEELVVIGAGPAGMAAALEAVNLGIDPILIDSYPSPGGQYYRQDPLEFQDAAALKAEKSLKNGALPERFSRHPIRILQDTVVWGIFEEEGGLLLGLYGPEDAPRRLKAKTIILAPGAYERPLPFPGWTLPGVMTVGAALILVKHQHVLPGKQVLISGTGPLQWVLAHHLIEAGAEVLGVLDANPFPWRGWQYAPRLWGQWERLTEGWQSLRTLWRSGQTIRWNQSVRAAYGTDQVERAVIGRVDGSHPESLQVDTICLGYGFSPATQLSQQAGCKHHYDRKLGGWVPLRDNWLETSIPGIFAAGDGAGIGGKDTAYLEGQIAAMGAVRELGRTISEDRAKRIGDSLKRQKRFAEVLSALFPYPAELIDLATEETLICRCEEITLGDLQCMIKEGATTYGALRKLSRAGMGRCQGRMCRPAVVEILARQTGQKQEEILPATPRPPVIPIPLHGLVDRTAEKHKTK